MRELPRSLMADASLVVIDQLEAAIEESGELIDALASSALSEADLVELGTALTTKPETTGRTVFKSVGVGPQDWAVTAVLAAQ